MARLIAILLILFLPAAAAGPAKNVILFIGDAAGIPTINGASIYKYNAPRKLFIQNLPNIGLMDTSTASEWVTDSAAGMTAIVTGVKTRNGVISQDATAVRGKKDGRELKTILEYAEQHGLSTGVVTNSLVADATPAACYAHSNDRGRHGAIFAQVLKPAYGDGIDVIIGPSEKEIVQVTHDAGVDIKTELAAHGFGPYSSMEAVPPGARRAVVLLPDGNFDVNRAAQLAIDILSRNPKGFFLMVESDCHMNRFISGLGHLLMLDDTIRQTVQRTNAADTLIVFAADHSYDFRIHGGKRGQPLFADLRFPGSENDLDSVHLHNVRRDDSHTGEEVMVSATGPGADRVHGYIANTDLFHIMLAAFGWDSQPASGREEARK